MRTEAINTIDRILHLRPEVTQEELGKEFSSRLTRLWVTILNSFGAKSDYYEKLGSSLLKDYLKEKIQLTPTLLNGDTTRIVDRLFLSTLNGAIKEENVREVVGFVYDEAYWGDSDSPLKSFGASRLNLETQAPLTQEDIQWIKLLTELDRITPSANKEEIARKLEELGGANLPLNELAKLNFKVWVNLIALKEASSVDRIRLKEFAELLSREMASLEYFTERAASPYLKEVIKIGLEELARGAKPSKCADAVARTLKKAEQHDFSLKNKAMPILTEGEISSLKGRANRVNEPVIELPRLVEETQKNPIQLAGVIILSALKGLLEPKDYKNLEKLEEKLHESEKAFIPLTEPLVEFLDKNRVVDFIENTKGLGLSVNRSFVQKYSLVLLDKAREYAEKDQQGSSPLFNTMMEKLLPALQNKETREIIKNIHQSMGLIKIAYKMASPMLKVISPVLKLFLTGFLNKKLKDLSASPNPDKNRIAQLETLKLMLPEIVPVLGGVLVKLFKNHPRLIDDFSKVVSLLNQKTLDEEAFKTAVFKLVDDFLADMKNDADLVTGLVEGVIQKYGTSS